MGSQLNQSINQSTNEYLESELMPEEELSLWADDRSLDAKLAVLETQGEFFSLPPLLEEVVWFEPRDSTDQEDRSSDLSTKKTQVLISYHKCRRYIWRLAFLFIHPDPGLDL